MKRLLLLALLCTALTAHAAPALKVAVAGLSADGWMHKAHAACIPTLDGKSTRGENLRPTISWSKGPAGTRSYAIVVSDADVPADLTRANIAEPLAENAPRQTFYHWVQFDIPPDVLSIPGGPKPIGFGHSASNDVGNSPATRLGYGGPCPPWNDERLHRYHFTVVALDVPTLDAKEGIAAAKAEAVIARHALARGSVTAYFTLNPALGASVDNP